VTVAAVILYANPEGALKDAAGRAAVRRTVESAWAGGATPIIVVSSDPDGAVSSALAGSPAVLAEPAPIDSGPVGQIARGMQIALEQVRETDACLIWPGRMAWVDAETVTTLIEAHGPRRAAILRPTYSNTLGWPALLPVDLVPALARQGAARMPDELIGDLVASGWPLEAIDTGDPGVMNDISTHLDSLPAYEGPPQPVAGPVPEWGAAAAEMPDEAPLEGPSLAPYGQAAEEGD
jgi:CTP:molybdopterin cytidylyltransferase MocA